MEYWLELRTALILARVGTVKAASRELGVHRATVNRQIETLEAAFGERLFFRHARGYSLTETGEEMLEVASRADEMFADMIGRVRNREERLSGTLTISSLPGIAPMIMPAMLSFQDEFPEINLCFMAETKHAKLEYGEAHIAFRSGEKPQDLDYVVRPFRPLRFGLYASQSYIDRHGLPTVDTLNAHRFVGPLGMASKLPFQGWFDTNVTADQLSLKTQDPQAMLSAICAGFGVGFLAEHDVAHMKNMVEIIAPDGTWMRDLWLLTHVDLDRTRKVQLFVAHAKSLMNG
ncbi:MAG: LysR family transcriptional regulator [Pseudomonadota bacterium]